MKTPVSLALVLSALFSVHAFPPAPHHTLFGVVKNQHGTPMDSGDAIVVLSGPAGEVMRGPIDLSVAPGINYSLQVAQDSARTGQLYTPTAMLPTSPFTIRVEIGETSYLPIELQGEIRTLGASGESTRLDLTLGEDSDGDGLPDAWERDVIDFDPEDGIDDLADVNPDDDSDGDGMTNGAEYIAGTYAFDHLDALRLEVKEIVDGVARLEFVTITGRTYKITSSSTGAGWGAQTFSTEATGEIPLDYHRADTVTPLSVYVPVGENPSTLFRLHVE